MARQVSGATPVMLVDENGNTYSAASSGGGTSNGLTDTQLRASPVPVTSASTIADGADVAEGARADAAYTDATGVASGSVVSLLKGAFVKLANIFTVAGPAASGATAPTNPIYNGGFVSTAIPTAYTTGQIAPQWQSANGAVEVAGVGFTGADGVLNSRLYKFNNSGSTDANPWLLGIAAHDFDGTSWYRKGGDASGSWTSAARYWTESTTALAASATFSGALRANGGTAGGLGTRFGFFTTEAFTDVTGGTLYIEKSVDAGATWRRVGSVGLQANTSVSLKVPVSAASYRAQVTNGGTAMTVLLLTSSYSLI